MKDNIAKALNKVAADAASAAESMQRTKGVKKIACISKKAEFLPMRSKKRERADEIEAAAVASILGAGAGIAGASGYRYGYKMPAAMVYNGLLDTGMAATWPLDLVGKGAQRLAVRTNSPKLYDVGVGMRMPFNSIKGAADLGYDDVAATIRKGPKRPSKLKAGLVGGASGLATAALSYALLSGKTRRRLAKLIDG